MGIHSLQWYLLGIFLNLYVCEGYKLLAIFPLPSKSHGILGENMVKHLLNAGHEVTYITPFIKKDVHPNLHIVDVSENIKLFNENSTNVKMIMDKEIDFQDADVITSILMGMAENSLKNQNVQNFMRDPKQTFDAVIAEWMFSDLYSGLATVFDCPLIWFSTIEPHWIVLNLVDGPLNPAYTSDYMKPHVPPFTFLERVHELYIQIEGMIRKNFKNYYKEEAIYRRLIAPVLEEKGRPVPSYDVVRHNASLLLGNSQVAIGEAISLPACYKHIGGYHIDDEVKPLPEDLKKIMDNAKHGVIYFSIGSNLRSKDLPTEIKRGILNVFGALKQTVIWKFEEVLPDSPKNVHFVSWAPQQSILAHKNVILFVTHGGLLSMTETVHFGVPVISIPVFADQFQNAQRVEKKGIGKKVDLSYSLHIDLKIALDEVLNNPKYTEKVKEISLAFHDRPLQPKDELVHWVSHVVRTRGAPHLRSPALPIPLYQRLYLDLIALILALSLVIKSAVIHLWCQSSMKKKKEKSS